MMQSLKLSAAVVDRLGWVLVHSLWQFALIAIVTVVSMRVLRRASADGGESSCLNPHADRSFRPWPRRLS